MRLNHLHLERYGKFTGRSISLPRARRDFHLIVGPNEAGKSTLRAAVLDLLFGFPTRTSIDFLHAKSDLRIAASIEDGDAALNFIRRKGSKNSLLSPDETPLAESALTVFLGDTGRSFFENMFGLDHPRLVAGGNSILSAQDDVGQILFQSAAGVSSLGRVRDALEQEAASLWAPTRSLKRSYYVARNDLDDATAALKDVSVQSKVWSDAYELVQSLSTNLQSQRATHLDLQAQRNRLERIRRVRVFLQELVRCENALAELGQVPDLPVDAAQIFDEAERAQAMAQQRLSLHCAEVERLQAELAGIEVDDRILGLATDIAALDSMRHKYGAHEANIVHFKGKLALLSQEAAAAATQLGWGGNSAAMTVEALASRLPGLPDRRNMAQLIGEYSVAMQALESATAAFSSRQAEDLALQAKLQSQEIHKVGEDVRAALSRARAQGDTDLALHKARSAYQSACLLRDSSRVRLDAWMLSAQEIDRIAFPSAQTVSGWLAERQRHLSSLESARLRRDELAGIVGKATVALKQHGQLHHPVTQEELALARGSRDQSWSSIKSGAVSLQDSAAGFEAAIQLADKLADSRCDKAQEAAHQLALQHQLEQDSNKLTEAERYLDQRQSELDHVSHRWSAMCREFGLKEISIDQMPDFLALKDKALEAYASANHARTELEALQARYTEMALALSSALENEMPQRQGVSKKSGAIDLPALCVQAEQLIRDADAARIRYDEWQVQAVAAKPMLAAATQAVELAEARVQRWQASWSRALERAGLDSSMSVAAVDGALTLIDTIAEKIEQLRQIRVEHVDAMLADLQGFVLTASRIAVSAGFANHACDVATSTDAFRISQELCSLLAKAHRAKDHHAAVSQALRAENEQLRVAQQALSDTRARLQPLMDRAGVSTTEPLSREIARCGEHRRLAESISTAQVRLAQDGDGHTREQLQAETDAVDLAAIEARSHALQADIQAVTEQQTALTVALAQAQSNLDSIAGADAAAKAESKRQAALAAMSDASERYVKVFTAAKLLRWSIDRYREEKQGPMLARASEIFAQLTLGSFVRLKVDFDTQPMALEGQRDDGRLVPIAGMSDGTRDQLYLALRLAALELHLQQATALPFIADDLFINYDDARSEAGLRALADLSERTQVIFLSHHDHLVDVARRVFGDALNVVVL